MCLNIYKSKIANLYIENLILSSIVSTLILNINRLYDVDLEWNEILYKLFKRRIFGQVFVVLQNNLWGQVE